MNPVDTNAATNKNAPPALSPADSQMLQSSLWMMAQAQGENAARGPAALSTTPTLAGLWQALQRRWPLALGVSVGATVLAVLAVFFVMPPLYQTSIRIRVAKQAGAEDVTFAIFTANMEALVKSPLVLSAALNDKTADGRDIKDLGLVRRQGLGAIDWLEKELKTDYKLGPEVLRVTLASDEPQDAADLLNAIAKAFFNEYAQMEASKKQQRLAELRGKKERIEDDLRGLRTNLDRILKQLDVKDLQQAAMQVQYWQNKIAAAETDKRANDLEISRTHSDILTYEARLKNLDKQPVPDAVLNEFYSRDGSIQANEKKLADIDEQIADCFRKYVEPYATQAATPLKRDKESLRAKRSEREAELKPKFEVSWRKQVREEFENQIAIGKEKLQSFDRRRESLDKEIRELNEKAKAAGSGARPPQIVATEEKIELAKKSLEWTAQKISDVELEVPGSRIIPLAPAAVPLEKDRTRQTKIAGAGGLAVFFFALFGVAFIEFRSRKIGLADEVNGLGLKVLGTMPALPPRNQKTDAAAAEKWQARLNESVDAIRTVILHQARTEALHVLMVTSAQSGEGKTTLATQLAGSLARAWKRTLVIDGDLRHPATHVLFDTPQEPGLAEVLRGEVEPTDAIRATPFARLWLLPAGNGDAHAIQALAQDNVRTLFEALKQQYDFIIIDSPPVLPVTDTLLLGQHVDGLVYAVLSEVSRAPAIHAAQQKLAPLGVRTLGAVVLGTQAEFDEKNYGYALGQAK
jgi:capsular exopolysaccharide synthesis family protein